MEDTSTRNLFVDNVDETFVWVMSIKDIIWVMSIKRFRCFINNIIILYFKNCYSYVDLFKMTNHLPTKKEVLQYFNKLSLDDHIKIDDVGIYDIACDIAQVTRLHILEKNSITLYKNSVTPKIMGYNIWEVDLFDIDTNLLFSFYSPLSTFQYIRLCRVSKLKDGDDEVILDLYDVKNLTFTNPLPLNLLRLNNHERYKIIFKLKDLPMSKIKEFGPPFSNVMYVGSVINTEIAEILYERLRKLMILSPLDGRNIVYGWDKDKLEIAKTEEEAFKKIKDIYKRAYDENFHQLVTSHCACIDYNSKKNRFFIGQIHNDDTFMTMHNIKNIRFIDIL